jgi:HD superfamily phosphohydrolase
MHLMHLALEHLQSRGHEVTREEEEAASIAILLHDIGHGPFSHALEHTIVDGVSHEKISRLFMANLNKEFNGKLDLALSIFNNQYHKKYLHQLISGQLDLDRLDYLNRDSFFSGVTEGSTLKTVV